jgi:putative chitinase
MNLTKLKGHLPDQIIKQLPECISKFEINTPLRLSHFLSQVGHESGNFRIVTENLNYNAPRLLEIFPKYFNNTTSLLYERKPEKIANIVYASRMGNGDKSTGDGYKFRGRGYIQLTGRDNYIAFSKAINEDMTMNPDLVATKYPLLSAAWFFQRCLKKCDLGATEVVITAVTKCVNGGIIGLDDRIKHFNEYYTLVKD